MTCYFPGTTKMVLDLKIFEDDRQMKQSVSSIDVGHHTFSHVRIASIGMRFR